MALNKSNFKTANFGPGFSTPPTLTSYKVNVQYQILDDLDDTTITVSKDIDIWPLLTPQQQNTLQNITQAVISLALSRA